ncbi:MAG: hypothetical protein F6K10_14940 [Moorea sp. SIO2B7]|nr:hypothetical protein [Moorena sp. SIO2B7]
MDLADFIKQVKAELLTPPKEGDDIPLLSVDSVELELRVVVKKEDGGNIGFNLSVLTGEAADKLNEEQMQTVKVTLSPLLDKEKLLRLYLKKNPDKKDEFLEQALEGGTKGNETGNEGVM